MTTRPVNPAGAGRLIRPRPDTGFVRLFGLAVGLVAILLTHAAAARGAPESFADLAARLTPAVVNISTSQSVTTAQGPQVLPQLPPGTPFEDLFRDFFERRRKENKTKRKVTSLGSGFIIDPAGYVVTNNHVIADAEEITVILNDDREFPAKLIGHDPKTDLALLKIESKEPLPAVSFGDSDKVRVGDWVLAIGNPFGLGNTVTAGILSARGRDINAGPYDDFLQTDAPINRGNSGGPLFNMDGEVIGINTAIFSPSGGSVGIGFSVPSALAKPVIEQLREFGRTKRGWLGVRIQAVSDDIAEGLGLDEARGALVADITPDSPAAKAGIKTGDVILEFDGQKIQAMRELPRIVANTRIGKAVDVVVLRKGERKTLKVTIAELEESDAEVASATPKEPVIAEADALGLTLSSITPELRDRFGIAEDVEGVVVTDVRPDGNAAARGVRPGDVVVEVGLEPVKRPKDVLSKVEAAAKANRKSVLLLLDRGGDQRFVAIEIGKG